jgi:hypothetical protein
MTYHDPRQCDLLALLERPTLVQAPLPVPPPCAPADDAFASCPAQEVAKRALEIAAVGPHSMVLVGTTIREGQEVMSAGVKIGVRCHSYAFAVGGFDLAVSVGPIRDFDRRSPPPSDSAAEVARRVAAAQAVRGSITLLQEPAAKLMDDARKAMRFDDAAELRIMAVARSIAALAGSKEIGRIHVAEALSYYARPVEPPPAPEPEPEPEPEPDAAEQAWRARQERWEIVEVDPKRLDYDGGDIRRSYSAQSLGEQGAIKSPFRFRGGEWVNTGGSYFRGKGNLECYRIVPLEAFDGPSAPYREHDWERMRGNEEVGAYHGMSAKHGSREIVLQGPPIVFVSGQPEQSALL